MLLTLNKHSSTLWRFENSEGEMSSFVMSGPEPHHFFKTLVCTLVLLCVICVCVSQKFSKLPNGPLRFPLLGTIPSIIGLYLRAKGSSVKMLRKLAQDLDSAGGHQMHVLGERLIWVVSDRNLLEKLLNGKLSRFTAGRPNVGSFVANKGTPDSLSLAFSSADRDSWKRVRSFVHGRLLAPIKMEEYVPLVGEFADKLIAKLEEKGDTFPKRIDNIQSTLSMLSAELSLRIMWGEAYLSTLSEQDLKRCCTLLCDAGELGVPLLFEFSALDFWPSIAGCLPLFLSKLLKSPSKERKRYNELKYQEFEMHREAILWFRRERPNKEVGGQLVQLLEAFDESLDDDSMLNVVRDLVSAAFYPVVDTMVWVIRFFLQKPQVQDRIYQEAQMIGSGQIGYLSKPMKEETYLSAVFKELHRLASFVPFGLFRETKCDLTLEDGTHIPKGTWIMPFLYAINHNESVFAHPDSFQPERWMPTKLPTTDGDDPQEEQKRHFVPFSIGTRMCPGYAYAEFLMKVILVEMLLKYKLKPTPENETEILNYTSFTLQNIGVPFEIIPRCHEG